MNRKKWTNEKVYSRLQNKKSKKTYWDNIRELHSRPNQNVFEKAFWFANSKSDKEKIIGIDVLAQLGIDCRPYLKETIGLYFELLKREKVPKVLASILYAIGHNNEGLKEEQILQLIEFKNHKNVIVREGLVIALLTIENKKVIGTLIELMDDEIESIRNWSTFGIGSQLEENNPEIINALWKRVTDINEETKLEAIVGLANRGDLRIKEVIIQELEKGKYGTLLFDAIEKLNDKEFLPYLEQNLISIQTEKEISDEWRVELEKNIEKLKEK